jgi:hypothetical protein
MGRKYNCNLHIKGDICSGEVHTGFWWGDLRGKKPLGRPMQRWEGHIKMDFEDVGCGGMDWIDLAEDRELVGSHV